VLSVWSYPSDKATVNDWSWLDAIVGPLDKDVAEAVAEQPQQQERPALADFFC
jgi:antitoxin VapB